MADECVLRINEKTYIWIENRKKQLLSEGREEYEVDGTDFPSAET